MEFFICSHLKKEKKNNFQHIFIDAILSSLTVGKITTHESFMSDFSSGTISGGDSEQFD